MYCHVQLQSLQTFFKSSGRIQGGWCKSVSLKQIYYCVEDISTSFGRSLDNIQRLKSLVGIKKSTTGLFEGEMTLGSLNVKTEPQLHSPNY